MGKRGPKPGFKQVRAEAAARAALEQGAAVPAHARPPAQATAVKPEAKRPARARLAPKAADNAAGAAQPGVCCDPALLPGLPTAHRENPEKLGGAALRHLAHRRGISRSEAERLSDVKLREQLRYLAYKQYAEA